MLTMHNQWHIFRKTVYIRRYSLWT